MTEVRDIKDREPNKDTIEQIEWVLEQAKAGEIRSIVCLCGWADDAVSHSWSLDHRNSKRPLLSEIVMLQHDFTTNLSFEEGDTVLAHAFDE